MCIASRPRLLRSHYLLGDARVQNKSSWNETRRQETSSLGSTPLPSPDLVAERKDANKFTCPLIPRQLQRVQRRAEPVMRMLHRRRRSSSHRPTWQRKKKSRKLGTGRANTNSWATWKKPSWKIVRIGRKQSLTHSPQMSAPTLERANERATALFSFSRKTKLLLFPDKAECLKGHQNLLKMTLFLTNNHQVYPRHELDHRRF